jgi:hypothetical protein
MADKTALTWSGEDPTVAAPHEQQEREPHQVPGPRRRPGAAASLLGVHQPARAWQAGAVTSPAAEWVGRLAARQGSQVTELMRRTAVLPVPPGAWVARQRTAQQLSPVADLARRRVAQQVLAVSSVTEQFCERLREPLGRASGLDILNKRLMEAAGLCTLGQRLSAQLTQASGLQAFRERWNDTLSLRSRGWNPKLLQSCRWTHSIRWSWGPALGRMREQWAEFARVGAGLAQDLALRALLQALEARDAILRGDRQAVVRFIVDWLGWSPTEARVEAVSMVLLEAGWDQVEAIDARATERAWREFRARALQQHRVQRPVWETQVNGERITLLDQPVRLRGRAEPVPFGDLVEDPRAYVELATAEGGYDDPRLEQVLRRLRPADQAVVLAYGLLATSWADAAALCGRPPEDGDKVRCRVKYVRRLLEGR